jgi:hypothetical protein
VQYFNHHSVEHCIISLPTWEENKDMDLLLRVEEAIENFKINRCRLQSGAVRCSSVGEQATCDMRGMCSLVCCVVDNGFIPM